MKLIVYKGFDNEFLHKDYDSNWDVENYKMETLLEYYDIDVSTLHRSREDALATGWLFLNLVDERMSRV